MTGNSINVIFFKVYNLCEGPVVVTARSERQQNCRHR